MQFKSIMAIAVASGACVGVDPYVPSGTLVPVHVSASSSKYTYELKVISSKDKSEQVCRVPCSMNLLAGSNQFILSALSGQGSFYQMLTVPVHESNARIKERNFAQLLIGASLAFVGYLGLAGAGFAIKAYNDEAEKLLDMDRFSEADAQQAGAKRSLITAGIFGGIGLLGTVIGLTAKKSRVVLEPVSSSAK